LPEELTTLQAYQVQIYAPGLEGKALLRCGQIDMFNVGFLKWGYPRIIHFNKFLHINHPAMGVPPFIETTIYRIFSHMTHRLILQVALITVEEERLVKLRSNLSWVNLGAGGGCLQGYLRFDMLSWRNAAGTTHSFQ